MNQPYLTRCIECEKQISSSAYKCPHCQTTSPFGITCHICNKKLRKSKAKQVLDSEGDPIYSAHEECLNWVQQEVVENQKVVYQCPVCRTSVTISHSLKNTNCHNCGHSLSMNEYYAGKCKHCRNTVLKGFEVNYNHNIYHKLCANKAYPNWEIEENQRQQKRKEAEQNKKRLEEAEAEKARKIRERQKMNDRIGSLSSFFVFGLPILLLFSGIAGFFVAVFFASIGLGSVGNIIGIIVGILVFITYLTPKK